MALVTADKSCSKSQQDYAPEGQHGTEVVKRIKNQTDQIRDSSERRTPEFENEHCHEKKYSRCVLTKDRSAQI
jgi:hypothetical protein